MSYFNTLAKHRKQHGLSRTQVAELVGSGRVEQITSYERGERLPSFPTAAALAAVFDVRVEQLFPGTFVQAHAAIQRKRHVQSRKRHRKPYVPKPNTTSILSLCFGTRKVGVAVFEAVSSNPSGRAQVARQACPSGARQPGGATRATPV